MLPFRFYRIKKYFFVNFDGSSDWCGSGFIWLNYQKESLFGAIFSLIISGGIGIY